MQDRPRPCPRGPSLPGPPTAADAIPLEARAPPPEPLAHPDVGLSTHVPGRLPLPACRSPLQLPPSRHPAPASAPTSLDVPGERPQGFPGSPPPWGTALIQGPPLPQTPCSRWPSGVPRAEREHYPAGIPSPHSILRRAPGLGQDAPWGPRAAHLPRGPGPNFGPRDGLRNPPRPAGGRPGSPARSGTRPRPRGQRRATGPMLPGPGRRPPSPDLTRVAADTQRPQGQGPIYPRAPGGRHVPDLSFDEETVVSSHSFCSDFQGML